MDSGSCIFIGVFFAYVYLFYYVIILLFVGLNKLWIGNLLGIAAHPGCAALRDRVVEEVAFLLRNICSKDPHIFTRLVEELIYTLAGQDKEGRGEVVH